MRIESASISLASQYQRVETRQEKLSLSVSFAPARGAAVAISEAGQAAAAQAQAIDDALEQAQNDPRFAFLLLLIEKLTGQKVSAVKLDSDQGRQPQTAHPTQSSRSVGIALDYAASHTLEQQLQFAAQGSVRTADGREIQFQYAFDLQATESEQVNLSLRAGSAVKDPLVLNFTGSAAQLSAATFNFDLDSDGKAEQVAQLAAGNGFLALDKNGDGKINNGQELFGPTSGDGFADLAAYDSDGNHFIDEADSIYQQLRIYTPDAQGNGQLLSLQAAGVGALFLGRVTSPFEFDGGILRSSSIYLSENGSAGSLQQIDLKV